MMTKITKIFAVTLYTASLLTMSGTALAQCAARSSPGLRICFPSAGSTVMYVSAIEMAGKPSSGTFTKVNVYDNGKLVDNFDFLPGTLYDYAIKNGPHTVVINAWDSAGKLYQATRTFNVTGYGVGFCSLPSAAGVNLCWPKEGSWQPNTTVPISATARGGTSKIKSLAVYVDGKFLISSSTNYIQTGVGVGAGRHRVAVVAKDFAGNSYKSVNYFNAYYNYDCDPFTDQCSPGIELKNPDSQDVPTSFRLDAQVVNNTLPTTSMKVYLDGAVIASSTGPGITAQLDLPKGSTHIVWVRAWDTSGKRYATYQTLYVH